MTATVTVFKAKSDLIVLPGGYRPEYWAMLAKRVACCNGDETVYASSDYRQRK